MQSEFPSHPDRAATTLATAAAAREQRGAGPFAPPGAGARDCRMDLKLLQWRAKGAAAAHAVAAGRLAEFDAAAHPDLWAGTVQDGTARGFAAALEEAVALAADATAPAPAGRGAALGAALATDLGTDPEHPTIELTGRALRRKKDLLVASAGPRVRFSRREGLLFVDRASGTNSPNCLRFEARRDLGTLDGFVADPAERPRLFSAQFLRPVRYLESRQGTRLELTGRLGRGPVGWPITLVATGSKAVDQLELSLHLHTCPSGWRLRARFLGVRPEHLQHECEDVREVVASDTGGFVAFTLVRACTTLLVDGTEIAVPAAARPDPLTHTFRLQSGQPKPGDG